MGAEVPVPANTRTTLRTSCAEKPCLLCWLRARVKESEEASAASFSTEPLHLNILGLRQENTMSDDFDDAMAVFCKMLPHDQQDNYEKAVEQKIRDELAGIKSGRVKIVPCTSGEFTGTWIVGLFDQVTTDPGLESRDKDEQKQDIEKAKNDLEKKKKEVDDQDQAAKDSKKAVDDKQTEQKDLRAKKEKSDDDRSTIKANDAAMPKLADKAKKDAEKLKKLQKEYDRQAAALKKKQAALDASDHSLVQMSEGHAGWLAQGRAQIAPGIYAGEYRFGVHHDGAEKIHHGHVAMTVGYIQGFRYYSVGNLLTLAKKIFAEREKEKKRHQDAEDKAKKAAEKANKPAPAAKPVPDGSYAWADDRIVVARHYGPGGKRKFDGKSATLELRESADGKSYEAYLHENGSETKLGADEDVIVRAQIGGTNLHRAHNAGVKNGKPWYDHVEPGGRVGDWSEGCQTYRQYKYFNEFIRLCQISKRWRCVNAPPSAPKPPKPPIRCQVLEANDGEPLGAGEQCMVDVKGEAFIFRAVAAIYADGAKKLDKAKKKAEGKLKDAEEKQKKLDDEQQKMLEQKEKAQAIPWSDDDEKKLHDKKTSKAEHAELKGRDDKRWKQANEDKLSAKATEAKAAGELVTACEKEIEQVDKDIAAALANANELEEKAEKEDLEKAIPTLEANAAKLDADVKQLDTQLEAATDAKKKKDLGAKLKAKTEDKTKADADLAKKKARLDELKLKGELREELKKRRREFLRDRCQFFGSDYYRECDMSWACPVRFTYVLIELTASEFDDLQHNQYSEARNLDWNGDVVTG